jgi:cellulose synthase/poly-beta-1,6-N-acetylglucosamine synthase-like glycosyltransferase
MISIIITAFKESKTIGKAIESFINQDIKEKYELIISAPDKKTLDVAKKFVRKNKSIKLSKDPGKGKSYALNLLLSKVKGRIIILSDGDVYVSNNSVNEILKEFENSKIGCVTGRPVPMEDRKTKYGYWANFLFYSAHRLRKKLRQENKFLECSGYLWAFKNNVIKNFPLDVAEDTIIPYFFWEKGFKIGYAENALVYIKNVDNWKEWLSQKTRTSKAHETLDKYVDTKKTPRTKTFLNEAKGFFDLFLYAKTFKEFFWSIELIFARFYMWIVVFSEVYLKKKYHQDKWKRVESTK